MPRRAGPRSDLVYVPIKIYPDTVTRIDHVARQERHLWHDFGGSVGERPSRSAASRHLIELGLEVWEQRQNKETRSD